ncbi:MAG TPA: twin-arginine translocation signal domain-containing protein [Pyrinomonadaceae bacterium]|nr:twin-arginine translocation signal domain-containing protein [Pyrinomonadaceae bacterium]
MKTLSRRRVISTLATGGAGLALTEVEEMRVRK